MGKMRFQSPPNTRARHASFSNDITYQNTRFHWCLLKSPGNLHLTLHLRHKQNFRDLIGLFFYCSITLLFLWITRRFFRQQLDTFARGFTMLPPRDPRLFARIVRWQLHLLQQWRQQCFCTYRELTNFLPNGCSAQGDSSMESEGANFSSSTKLKRDHVCTRSLRPVVMAAARFFLQISEMLFPSNLKMKVTIHVKWKEGNSTVVILYEILE